jgi:hypothetical protein
MGLLFTADAHAALASGAVTVTFRLWKRPQVKVDGRYRVGELTLVIDELDQCRVGDITRADLRRAGFADVEALRVRLAPRDRSFGPDTVVWRVTFHVGEADPGPALADRAPLATGEVAEIVRRLDRLDRVSPHGPWTRRTLRLIQKQPGVVSTRLAEQLGRDRPSFKLDVRKLKALGLTRSLEVGYELSPRGTALLASIGR